MLIMLFALYWTLKHPFSLVKLCDPFSEPFFDLYCLSHYHGLNGALNLFSYFVEGI
uniref:Uncharacterized protein n=1 Tax=Rhizophora mucronata TaxID=61149 RepID=A0A2P2QTS5_RHIMU